MLKKQLLTIYAISFLTAFCSLIYELQYSQLLSVLYGNSVLRYSLTIGLYLFSLGIGSFSFRLFVKRKTEEVLWTSQILLALIGPLGIVGVIWLDSELFKMFQLNAQNYAIFLAHVPIVITGILAGIQIPLLSVLGNDIKKRQDMFVEVLGIDYFGSLIGAVSYGLFLYPQIGLIKTAFLVGAINCLLALFCLVFIKNKKPFLYLSIGLMLVFIVLNINESKIENAVMQVYLTASIDKERAINKSYVASIEPKILSFFLPRTRTLPNIQLLGMGERMMNA
jgi:spermidine synthase